MRSVLFGALSFAAVLGVCTSHEANAAPVAVVAPVSTNGSGGGPIQPVYYYRGQHYRYRYGGRYYHHRAYRHGRWHYY